MLNHRFMYYPRIVLGICLMLPTSYADRIYVSAGASEEGDGSSWEMAYRYLQDALDQTVAGRGD